MKSVREKIMWDAMISQCCANFLSDIDIHPGRAQSGGALNEKGHQLIRFSDGMTRWDETHLRLPKRTNMIAGSMRRERFAKRATLEIDYEWFRFRESKNGFSMLTLWGRELPDTICAAASQGYRLLDLVDFSSIAPIFFIRANPRVHALKNVVRMRRIKDYGTLGKKVRSKGLVITMKDEWSRENWGYWTPEDGYSSTMDRH